MPRFLLALTVTLTALTFALAVSASAWGETQPPHPALRGFVEGCEGIPQPCWYGIVPGETLIREAVQMLKARGYQSSQWGRFALVPPADASYCMVSINLVGKALTESEQSEDEPLEMIAINNCPDLRVGSLMAVLGIPNYLFRDCWANGQLMAYEIGFDVYLEPPTIHIAPSPHRPLDSFNLMTPSSQNWRNPDLDIDLRTFAWHGLATTQRYELIEPNVIKCDYVVT